VAGSKQTLLCTYLSAVLLVGLGLNSLFGWSWANPIAALVIAGVAVREGVEAWRGETAAPPSLSFTPRRKLWTTAAARQAGPMLAAPRPTMRNQV
jgi:hypothetical protein